jgi:uncharacterized protein
MIPTRAARHSRATAIEDSDAAPGVTLAVLAKAPRPARVKTRLCPPCTPAQAAALALAALEDTLAAVRATAAPRRVLILDGEASADGFELLPQRGRGLAERLAHAFADIGEPAFLVGMDTPQLTPALLATGQAAVAAGFAAVGPALDGGYWGIGLAEPDPRAFTGVPMSTAFTGAAQQAALERLGLEVAQLPALRDVDTIADAHAVAAQAPATRFAAQLAALDIREGLAAPHPTGAPERVAAPLLPSEAEAV